MHASAIRLYTRRLPTQYLCQRRRFSSRHYDATGGYLARSASTVLSVACAGIAGWAFYHTSSGKERTESRSVPQDDTDGVAELVSDLDWKFKAVLPYIVKTASAALRLNEMDSLGNVNSGVRRFYSARHAANVPIEDDLATTSTELFHGGVWSFWGIYDGHAGSATSSVLAQALIPHVIIMLVKLYQPAWDGNAALYPNAASIDRAIASGFVQLDEDIINGDLNTHSPWSGVGRRRAKFLNAAISILGPGYAGSSALLSFYDSKTKLLRVACVGNSRAVLGRQSLKGTYSAIPLSVDQIASGNRQEVERIRAAHPGEPGVIKGGKLLGMKETVETRAFGDGLYKWPKEIVDENERKFFGKPRLSGYYTPPYLTAEPVITTTEIQPDDFMIMASDGFWDHVTNDQAVDLVQRWLDKSSRDGIRNEIPDIKDPHLEIGSRKRVSTGYRANWQIKEEDYVVEDENAATHLIKNAFGGGDRELLCGVMTAPAPLSRDVRDDITVVVIFFGEGKREPMISSNIIENLGWE